MSGKSIFASLPRPEMIETIDIEHTVETVIADFKERVAAAGGEYNVEKTSYDPAKIQIETNAWRENAVRVRINDAVAANLLAFAMRADLDHLAAFYDIYRLSGELDDALRERTVLAIQARSPGGSAYWYEAAARRADVRIRDVVVYREDFLPIIHIAVLSSQDDGIPDQAMLEAVNAIVQSDTVRTMNDTIIVEAAVTSGTIVIADIWLLPDAPISIMDTLEAVLREAWQAESGVGFDLEPSWLKARLHVAGVKKVEILAPSAAIVVPAGSAISLGTIKLNFKGRIY